MKRGRGTCGTFQSYKLTYLHKLRAGMVYITLWDVHVSIPAHIVLNNFFKCCNIHCYLSLKYLTLLLKHEIRELSNKNVNVTTIMFLMSIYAIVNPIHVPTYL